MFRIIALDGIEFVAKDSLAPFVFKKNYIFKFCLVGSFLEFILGYLVYYSLLWGLVYLMHVGSEIGIDRLDYHHHT